MLGGGRGEDIDGVEDRLAQFDGDSREREPGVGVAGGSHRGIDDLGHAVEGLTDDIEPTAGLIGGFGGGVVGV